MKRQTRRRLDRLLDAMERAYAEVKAASERAVVEWRWATGRSFGLTPFEPERLWIARGVLLPKPPRSPRNSYACGFDAYGVLGVLRGHGPDGTPDIEHFTQVRGRELLVRGFLDRGRLAGQVTCTERDVSGRPLHSSTVGLEGDWREETYVHQRGRLVRITETRFVASSERTSSRTIELTHARDGTVSGTSVDGAGHRERLFKGVSEPIAPRPTTRRPPRRHTLG